MEEEIIKIDVVVILAVEELTSILLSREQLNSSLYENIHCTQTLSLIIGP